MKTQLSLIIPTYQRADILKQCLEHIDAQTVRDQLEVIVVSDGPDSDTAKMVSSFDVDFFAIEKAQQGIARNRGLERASAPLSLFIGDDAFLEPDACERHLLAHQKIESAGISLRSVLGFTTWDPAVGITPVMQWLEKSGWQFGYPVLEKHAHAFVPESLQHRFTYTIHFSLPTVLARKYPFREDVTLYGWEDIEWGKRLATAGVKLYYEPDARALHHHRITLEQSLKRMETLGTSVVHLSRLSPDLDRRPKGMKLIAYHLAALLPTMAGRHRRAFLRGMKE